jgi:hypothetical protein
VIKTGSVDIGSEGARPSLSYPPFFLGRRGTDMGSFIMFHLGFTASGSGVPPLV